MPSPTITSFDDLRLAFGSFAEAGRKLGMSPQAFHDAKRRGALPKHRYMVQMGMLRRHGFAPAPELWGFEQPSEHIGAAE